MRQTVWKRATAGALAVGLLLATGAAAQLSEVDLVPGSGDGKVTLDAATGLYWLDLPETTNLSVPDVLGGAGGWVARGWRYAILIAWLGLPAILMGLANLSGELDEALCRYPFLLVDRVQDMVAGEWIKGYKNVTFNEDYFNGHFPGEPVMPGACPRAT